MNFWLISASVIAVFSACMTRSAEPPQPLPNRSGSPQGGADGLADPNNPFGDLDRETFTAGQGLVGAWSGVGDEIRPDSRWLVETRTNSNSPSTLANDIALSLNHPIDLKNENYQLLISAPRTSSNLEICEGDCNAPGVKIFRAAYVFFNASRKFYWTNATVKVDDGLRLELRSSDKSGQVTGQRPIEFVMKGSTRSRTPNPLPTSDPSASPNPVGISLNEATLLINQYCGGASCHSNYASNPLIMSKSKALSEMQGGTMPKNRSMLGQDRERLIQWLRQP